MDDDRAASGRYRVMERLATGGMAEVFYAEAFGVADFRKPVAIKRVLPHLAANEKFIRMFLDEARLAARLSHRNIVQVFDVGRMNDAYFIVMEYVDGATLRDLTVYLARKGRTMPVPIAVHIAIECANALAYAHELADRTGRPLGIVHRDVSPPNILISRSGGVKLVDFGLARARTQLEKTDPGVVKGKFAYLAPETAEGREVGPRADIFSLGAVLWEMLAGRPLFAADDDYATVERVRKCDVPSLHALEPSVPESLDALVRRALAREPSQRYARAADFARALTEFLFANRTPVTSDDVGALAREALGSNGPAVTGRQSSVSADESEKLLALSPVDTAGSPVSLPGVERGSAQPAPPVERTGGSRWTLYVGLALVVFAGAAVAWFGSGRGHRGVASAPAGGSAATAIAVPGDSTSGPDDSDAGSGRQATRTDVTVDASTVTATRTLQTVDASIATVTQPLQTVDASTQTEMRVLQTVDASVAPEMPAAVPVERPTATETHASVTANPRTRPTQPDGATRERMYRAMLPRIEACERRLGWQGRHARVSAQYEGSTGRVLSARLSGTYFPRRAIGACVLEAVRAVPAPPFRHARWSTDYAFWLR